MKKIKHNTGVMEECLRRYRVVAPTQELKGRVIGAARETWKAAPAGNIPWTWPVLRFAACLVAAAIPVFLAHTEDSSSGARSSVMERDTAPIGETAAMWAMTGWSQFASLYCRAATMREPDGADLLARHLRALSAELTDQRANGG